VSLQSASPSTVLPYSLCTAFIERRAFPIVENEPYVDGRTQRSYQAVISRKAWSLAKRLTWSEWSVLRGFYFARKGPLEPFYFYATMTEHDPAGESIIGRHIVRFEGTLAETYNIGRHGVELALVEVA
jgi:hypothetical protein